MPRVRLLLFATLREKFGVKELDLELGRGGGLRELFEAAADRLGGDFLSEVLDDSGLPRDDRIIMVNGRNVKDTPDRGTSIRLADGDVVAVFPPIAGG